jgi:hypothetical protein
MAEGSERRFRLLRYNNLKRKSGNKSLPPFPSQQTKLAEETFLRREPEHMRSQRLGTAADGKFDFILRGERGADNCQRNETEQ